MPSVIDLSLAPRTAVLDTTFAAPEVYQSIFTRKADPKSFHTHQGAKITAPLAGESRLHLQSHGQPAALPQHYLLLPRGWGHSPARIKQAQGSAAEVCSRWLLHMLCPCKEGYQGLTCGLISIAPL